MELVIRDLSKTYPNGTRAVNGVSLDIPKGMFGLLGRNGAGKSTLMRIIATLQDPDEGSARLGDIDVLRQKEEVRKTLGYLPQSFGFHPKARAERLLDHFAVLKGIEEPGARRGVVESLLRKTNLWEVRGDRLATFSGGMRQRFGVAVALLGDPKLIIVDEPTAGLDPEERVRFLNLLSEIGEDSLVILSTHIVEDVEELCSRMAIIDGGEILLEAVCRYLERFRDSGPPYPTTLDLYAELRAVTPDSLHPLLSDLFETVTLWDVRTERAVVEPTGTGEYVVTLDVVAKKMRADSVGNATEVPMDDLVEIGVFAPVDPGHPAGSGRTAEPLYLERHRIRSGEQTVRITVPREPVRAGIDPYRKLIDRQRNDNVQEVDPVE